jgi:hypothetical protein
MKYPIALTVAVLLSFIILSATTPAVLAQDLTLEINGTCREFSVTVLADGFDHGCYDVKIDVTTHNGRVGEIFDPMQGWKSSVYYNYDALCINDDVTSATFQVRALTDQETLNFLGKLRKTCCGMPTTQSSYYNITQDCSDSTPQPVGNETLLVVSLLVVLILIAAITLYMRLMK